MDTDSDLKARLDRTLEAAAQTGETIKKKGLELSSVGQSIVDWAGLTREAAASISDPAATRDLTAAWERTNAAALYLNIRLASVVTLVTSTADASNVSSLLNIYPTAGTIQGYPLVGYKTSGPLERMHELANRNDQQEAVAGLLEVLGFRRAVSGQLSACDHFETAHRAFSVGVAAANDATTWLIPIRECILTVLSRLLARRGTQEEAKGTVEKVLSIGRQLGWTELAASHFDLLAHECKRILDDELSPSKQKAHPRLQSASILFAATLWLKSFLSSIDPEKINKTAR